MTLIADMNCQLSTRSWCCKLAIPVTRQSFDVYLPLVSRHPALINEMFSNYLQDTVL